MWGRCSGWKAQSGTALAPCPTSFYFGTEVPTVQQDLVRGLILPGGSSCAPSSYMVMPQDSNHSRASSPALGILYPSLQQPRVQNWGLPL